MPDPRRLVTAGVAASLFEAALGFGLLIWVGPQRVSAVLLVAAPLTALLWLSLLALVRRDGDEGSGDEGGAPPPEPPWWPDFERDLRAYMRDRRRPPAGTRG